MQNLRQKSILITGGEGFIGSNLRSRLKRLGYEVKTYDINNGLDINDVTKLKRFIKRKFDFIYHLAAFSGAVNNENNKTKSLLLNFFATYNIADLILKFSPRTKLILSGSRLEYGPPEYLPVDEHHSTNPVDLYGVSKLMSSQLCLHLHHANKLKITIFRTSNVYGPHKDNKFKGYNLVNHFLNKAQKGKRLVIYGKGNQLRDYIYISDLISALLLALKPESNGHIYNVGFGKGIALRNMAQIIVEQVGTGKIIHAPWPEIAQKIETGSYVTDITKIKKTFGFSPTIDFETGISMSLNS